MTAYLKAMELAIREAADFAGATSPNPAVGAAALTQSGEILSIQAHQLAGTGHAEARLLADCRAKGILDQVYTVVVTLEPCNHQGRTAPCTEALLSAGVKRVVFAERDPNPRVAGNGAAMLARAGVEVIQRSSEASQELLAPFRKWVTTGTPYVVIKTAHLPDGSMIPPPGQKTFTPEPLLKFAHGLRRRADAILTGSGTVLADRPQFTVRHLLDHPGKERWVVVMDRSQKLESWTGLASWRDELASNRLKLKIMGSIGEALAFLGKEGALEVLVEAGPRLTDAVKQSGCWDLHYKIEQSGSIHRLVRA